ncbi:nuclear transport factor 2 family protein [Phytohabitans kaempferiae]|uniref:Nuclear transport factor 2 family protein n=1 Tax=Phytohabitans kaempferiae TaxID=1620943 RepID=A0ABV6M839_9ACTN
MTRSHDAVMAYWAAAEARDWPAFAALLADDVLYDLPQTRERILGKERYVQFNVEYPGDWHITVEMAVGEERHAATWTRFAVGGEEQAGLCFFEFDEAGLITKITDFWPEPYEPPAGREHLVERY